jgi:hypothetical protein
MRLLVSLVIAFGSGPIFGQSPTPIPASPTSAPPAVQTPVKPATAAEKFKRWFEFDTLSIAARYHFIRNENGRLAANNFQYQFIARGHFKFDEQGRYSIHAGLFTGNSFTAGWNNSGIGSGRYVTNLYLKQLYFDAKPVNGLEIQVGGIGLNNGENTEATGYDNDGYLTGERIAVELPKRLFFDEISASNGYIGDNTHPSVFRRLRHLGRSNYHQFMVRKQAGKNVSVSADYTFESGMDILRQAVKVTFPAKQWLDQFLFENYERLDPSPGYGFSVYGQKKLHKLFTLGGGFARIDRQMLNGDRFPRGNRLYVLGTLNFSRELSLTANFIRGVGPIVPALARTRLDIILTYNVLETLHRKKIM